MGGTDDDEAGSGWNGGDDIVGGDDGGGGSSERAGARERHGMTGSKQIDIPPAIADHHFVGVSHARGRGIKSSKQARESRGEGGRARKEMG